MRKKQKIVRNFLFGILTISALTIVNSMTVYTHAYYAAKAEANVTAQAAAFAFAYNGSNSESQSIDMGSLDSVSSSTTYSFTVSNSYNSVVAGVDLTAQVKLSYTNNLPLTCVVTKPDSTTVTYTCNASGTPSVDNILDTLSFTDSVSKTCTYKMVFTWNGGTDSSYSSLADCFLIQVDWSQVV